MPMHFTNKKVNALLAERGMNGEFRRGRGKAYAGAYIYTRHEKTVVICTVSQARFLGSPLEVIWKIQQELASRIIPTPPAPDAPDAAPRTR